MEQDHSNKKNVIIRTLGLIFGGILTCILVPAIFKFLIFSPIILLFTKNDIVIKSVVGGLTILVLILSYYYFYKFFEKRKITELSLEVLPKSIILGFLLGFGLISLLFLTLYVLGNYTVVNINSLGALFQPLMLFVVMGVLEEIIFRGIIFRIVEQVLNTGYALVISSLVFGFIHFTNSGFSFISGLAIFLHLGLLTGILYSITKNIWYPVFLHVGWNFAFVFFGVTLSGGNEFNTFLVGKLTGSEIITGGAFGPEDSIITIVLSLIVFAFLYHRKVKLRYIFAIRK